MKKMMAMALVLTMAVSLIACGENVDPMGGVESTAAQTENGKAQQGEENAAVTTEESTAEQEVSQTFDNSWASNEYEAQLPELPFEWSAGESHDPEEYLMKVKDVQYNDVKAYGELLSSCGFDMDLWIDDTTEGGNYRITARNKNGYTLDYDFNAYSYDKPITGLLTISVGRVEAPTTDVPEGMETVLTLEDIPAPVFTGYVFEEDDGEAHMYICREDVYGSVLNYEEALVDAGFQIEVLREYMVDGYLSRAYRGNAEIYIEFVTPWGITEVAGKPEDKGGIQISVYIYEAEQDVDNGESDNELMSQVPELPYEDWEWSEESNENCFVIYRHETDYSVMADYIATLESYGYEADVDGLTEKDNGEIKYNFAAENADGYRLSIFFEGASESGWCRVTISK